MRPFGKWWIVLVGLVATSAYAHDVEHHAPIVIDTDAGLDDVVALAMALQHPDLEIVAVVACEGVSEAERSVDHLERMLHQFNRQDIPLYAPATTDAKQAPPFRRFAEEAVGQALPMLGEPFRRPFSPDAYRSKRGKTVILVLGPLTNLAAALRTRPEIKSDIAEVVFAGLPSADESWNVRFDQEALATVRASGVPIAFVVPDGPASRKPKAWRAGELRTGEATSVGEAFFQNLLSPPRVRQHYTQQFDRFHDELALLYLVDGSLFAEQERDSVFVPNANAEIADTLARLLREGRQRKERVVFASGTLPDVVLQDDVRERKADIIAKNGETEWFAQLLMHELHEHMGAYSVIGVKMGLRAAELLNAPQHSMKVVSRVAARPPMSCVNDGLIVSTGSTPGRVLFKHQPDPADAIEASFEHNRREITLRLRPAYRERIETRFRALLKKHTLEDHEYWEGVRRVGLDIWEDWHRRDLFEVVEAPAASSSAHSE